MLRYLRSHRPRRLRLLALLALLACGGTTVAYGYLTATSEQGSTVPAVAARSLAKPATAPTASLSSSTVTVNLTQDEVGGKLLGTYPSGSGYRGGGYLVQRHTWDDEKKILGAGATPTEGTCKDLQSGTTKTLSCTDTSAPAGGTYKYTVLPVLNNFIGPASDASGTLTLMAADLTAPALVSLEMLDADTNGKVDTVKAGFDEPLASSTATVPWKLTQIPSVGNATAQAPASVSTSGSVATLTITEGSAAADTAVGNFKVELLSDAAGIRDAAGNRSQFAQRAPTDKARPVPTAMSDNNTSTTGSTNGKLATGDVLTIGFSEPLLVTSLSATTSITEDGTAAANNLLTIPGVTNGALNMGAGDYVASGQKITFAATAAFAVGSANKSIAVTAGAQTVGGNGDVKQGSAGSGMAYVPATTLTDEAGNTAAGSFRTNFPLF